MPTNKLLLKPSILIMNAHRPALAWVQHPCYDCPQLSFGPSPAFLSWMPMNKLWFKSNSLSWMHPNQLWLESNTLIVNDPKLALVWIFHSSYKCPQTCFGLSPASFWRMRPNQLWLKSSIVVMNASKPALAWVQLLIMNALEPVLVWVLHPYYEYAQTSFGLSPESLL